MVFLSVWLVLKILFCALAYGRTVFYVVTSYFVQFSKHALQGKITVYGYILSEWFNILLFLFTSRTFFLDSGCNSGSAGYGLMSLTTILLA